ncbi:cytochrome c oxidase accessory protein CcoG [Oceanimonas sp. CHS3-5]|uniref:cytochrome c oxidase accessory protein CcoG n=1 Tax=Oceanimonas sp. CHS3-5 TaxID=3068186 RepID=UPI00273E8714|nr:cytochrome c oxidase accessory protein CcoG [Oceanimonas sp. CHS3-5]MDP5290946.1 cytochrome c oxidase accessory protein CcoG [Oceanimonas sp. CHS3-5]
MNDTSSRIDVKVCTDASRPRDQGHIYVRAQQGRWQRLRRRLGWSLMLLFLLGPWLSWNGRQAILLDWAQQRFHLFGMTIWPQDLTLLALLLTVAAFGLFFITTWLGRVWCGFLCPQTVWTFWFIWVEQKLEGSANRRRQRDRGGRNADWLLRKGAKHLLWLLIALLSGFTFVAYFTPADELAYGLLTLSATPWPAFWVVLFTLCTYLNAGWMRTIMCTHMCPYSRFQSAMFDANTLSAAYDASRGEQRGPRSRNSDHRAQGLGDCIDCELCVQVCPAGIDIRDGLQYECINCGACIDACDQTMKRMGYRTGLVRYASENALAGRNSGRAHMRVWCYGVMTVAVLALLVLAVAGRSTLALEVVRDRHQLYRETLEGGVENTFTLKLANKSQQPQRVVLSVEGLEQPGWHGPQQLTLVPGEVTEVPISLSLRAEVASAQRARPILFVAGTEQDQVRTESRFLMP